MTTAAPIPLCTSRRASQPLSITKAPPCSHSCLGRLDGIGAPTQEATPQAGRVSAVSASLSLSLSLFFVKFVPRSGVERAALLFACKLRAAGTR